MPDAATPFATPLVHKEALNQHYVRLFYCLPAPKFQAHKAYSIALVSRRLILRHFGRTADANTITAYDLTNLPIEQAPLF
jgi:hypothetical protein